MTLPLIARAPIFRIPIAPVMIAVALLLSVPEARAQSRPAPGTPGVTDNADTLEIASPRRPALTRALRVLVVTAGIIGGFVAADFFLGGTLTAPLLGRTGVFATRGGIRFIPGVVGLRPVILPPVP